MNFVIVPVTLPLKCATVVMLSFSIFDLEIIKTYYSIDFKLSKQIILHAF